MSEPDASAAPRPIWLCADDYGISPAVSKGIRDLVQLGRLNATSVMVLAKAFDRAEADALQALNASGRRVAIGLHVTLTGLFEPMSADYRPTRGGVFLSLAEMMVRGQLRLLERDRLMAEVSAQLRAFVAQFGRTPDFVDGHQHSHLFPQVREALLDVVKERAPQAWVRQCGQTASLQPAVWAYKTRILNGLSRKFRELDFRFEPRFDFFRETNFAFCIEQRDPADFTQVLTNRVRCASATARIGDAHLGIRQLLSVVGSASASADSRAPCFR